MSASYTDGTKTSYVDPLKVGAGNGPWAVINEVEEPKNFVHNEFCTCLEKRVLNKLLIYKRENSISITHAHLDSSCWI